MILQALGLPRWLSGKESACQCKRRGSDSWVGIPPGGGNGNPLQYSCLENSMDRGALDQRAIGLQSIGLQNSWT